MEYLQFAFLAPLVALIADPLLLRVLAMGAGVLTFFIGAKHLRLGSVSHKFYLTGLRRTNEVRDVGKVARNLLYYGRWSIASVFGFGTIAWRPTQTSTAWVALAVGFVGLQVVVGFLNSDDE